MLRLKEEKQKNRLTVIEDEDGLPIYEEEQIAEISVDITRDCLRQIPPMAAGLLRKL